MIRGCLDLMILEDGDDYVGVMAMVMLMMVTKAMMIVMTVIMRIVMIVALTNMSGCHCDHRDCNSARNCSCCSWFFPAAL